MALSAKRLQGGLQPSSRPPLAAMLAVQYGPTFGTFETEPAEEAQAVMQGASQRCCRWLLHSQLQPCLCLLQYMPCSMQQP